MVNSVGLKDFHENHYLIIIIMPGCNIKSNCDFYVLIIKG